MKTIYNFLASKKLTLILLLALSVATGIATFVEEAHDTETAKTLIYSARWFEILLALTVLNLVLVLYEFGIGIKNRPGIFILHIAFIVMLIGAALTRYVGYEGVMHIREGSQSNEIHTYSAFFKAKHTENGDSTIKEEGITIAKLETSPFSFNIPTKSGDLKIRYKAYIPRASKTIRQVSEGGKEYLEIYTAGRSRGNTNFISPGESLSMDETSFSFEPQNEINQAGIVVKKEGKGFNIRSSERIIRSTPQGQVIDTLKIDSVYVLEKDIVYNLPSQMFVYTNYYTSGIIEYTSQNTDRSLKDIIVVAAELQGQTKDLYVPGGSNYTAEYDTYSVNSTEIDLAYGIKTIELPFALQLNDFILERYPGSKSPKSYESQVTLIDKRNGTKEKHRIYMNNVLDYDGYRFFQSSYDQDEKGTILSVSYDFWGKWVTYISYFLLFLGFLIPFFKKKSRFNLLRKRIKEIRAARKALMISLLIAIGSLGSAQAQNPTATVDKAHLSKFEETIVQSFGGRFEPVHTLAVDVLHKVSKTHTISTPEKGKLSPMEAFTDMMLNPQYWQSQAIVNISNEAIRQIVGISGEYASFNQFFDARGHFKLGQQSEEAFRKSPAEQSKFDKEVMKVNEQLNILSMAFNGDMLRIFPGEKLENFKWIAPTDSLAYRPITGKLSVINEDLQIQPFTFNNLFVHYINALRNGVMTNDYSRADRILSYIKSIQRQSTAAHILPSETKLKMEVHYNNARIFVVLKYLYMILSVVLLLLTFTENLKAKHSPKLSLLTNILFGVLAAAFLYHTYGMGLRWYIAGHAPWSNGYESLILVAWGGLLAGFIFMKYSRITLAATALLAFFVLLTAGFSTYDPKMTPLVPVLDSYWLIIHVAAMVVSYGFLGIGFILGIINLFIYLFKKEHNKTRINLTIKELTNINELNLQIGLFLAVAGTFLGAIWANESWGRYWGWDAKETWALIILLVYAIVIHMRHLPKFNDALVFNIASVIGFASVMMTFFGVNYYLTKGMHSYAAGDKTVFPLYAWFIIIGVLALITAAIVKEKYILKDEKIKTK
jgi:cytochrome c-type biogenesis protein CcsB